MLTLPTNAGITIHTELLFKKWFNQRMLVHCGAHMPDAGE